jgi:hypothetical protein
MFCSTPIQTEPLGGQNCYWGPTPTFPELDDVTSSGMSGVTSIETVEIPVDACEFRKNTC